MKALHNCYPFIPCVASNLSNFNIALFIATLNSYLKLMTFWLIELFLRPGLSGSKTAPVDLSSHKQSWQKEWVKCVTGLWGRQQCPMCPWWPSGTSDANRPWSPTTIYGCLFLPKLCQLFKTLLHFEEEIKFTLLHPELFAYCVIRSRFSTEAKKL